MGSNMSWWYWVQMLAMLAACLRFGAAEEGDPLPAALVELVRSSPISSIQDLQLLLFSDSVDGEEEGSREGHRLPRSLDAQPAQQALCKVRTEVVEVTRAMLDRSNANFLLWPPCVEVQRCSGCCNTKSLQCVPVLTHTRYLQVMKIQYVNKRPTYAKAVVSVVDHVECRCQPAPRPAVPRKKSSRRQQTHSKEPHRNQTLSQGQGKARSKENLHQQDELKHHQRVQLEELLERHWSPRGDTFTAPEEEGYSLAAGEEEGESQSRENILQGPHWVYNATRLLETKDGTDDNNRENADGRLSDSNNRTLSAKDRGGFVVVEGEAGRGVQEGREDGSVVNGTERRPRTEWRPRQDTQTDGPSLRSDRTSKTRHHAAAASESSERATRYPQPGLGLATSATTTKAPDDLRGEANVWLPPRPTKEPNPDPPPRGGGGQEDRRRDNETPEERGRKRSQQQTDEERLEQEKKELLLLHKRLDQEKELLRQQQMKREEEERERDPQDGGESRRHPHPHSKDHRRPQTTTQKIETMTTVTTTKPALAPAGPRPPARPNPPPRKRMRKNRKRISKAAMRAMLM